MSESDVRLPRALFVGLLLLTGVSLTGVAFLLGRESVPPPPVVVTAPAAPVATPAPVAVVPAPHSPPPVAVPMDTPRATVTMAPPSAPLAVASPPEPVPPPEAAPAVSTPAAPVAVPAKHLANSGPVKAYFEAVDKINGDKLGDDPEKFANELIQGAMNGNMSGMNKLVEDAEKSRIKLGSIHPPPPCKKFHEDSLALIEQSIHVLQSMTSALKNNDANALTALSGEAQAMQTKAQDLKDEEAGIKHQYGLQ